MYCVVGACPFPFFKIFRDSRNPPLGLIIWLWQPDANEAPRIANGTWQSEQRDPGSKVPATIRGEVIFLLCPFGFDLSSVLPSGLQPFVFRVCCLASPDPGEIEISGTRRLGGGRLGLGHHVGGPSVIISRFVYMPFCHRSASPYANAQNNAKVWILFQYVAAASSQ